MERPVLAVEDTSGRWTHLGWGWHQALAGCQCYWRDQGPRAEIPLEDPRLELGPGSVGNDSWDYYADPLNDVGDHRAGAGDPLEGEVGFEELAGPRVRRRVSAD